jgi:hypothetical protein
LSQEEVEMIFHPSGWAAEIIADTTLTDEQKKKLLESLGPEAGEFFPEDKIG